MGKNHFESRIYFKSSIHMFSVFMDGKGNPSYYALVKVTPVLCEKPGQTRKM